MKTLAWALKTKRNLELLEKQPNGKRYEFRPWKAGRGHPLVRQMIHIANRQEIPLQWLAAKSGVSARTIDSWRDEYNPTIDKLEACLNAIGYCLIIEPVPEEKEDAPESSPQQIRPTHLDFCFACGASVGTIRVHGHTQCTKCGAVIERCCDD